MLPMRRGGCGQFVFVLGLLIGCDGQHVSGIAALPNKQLFVLASFDTQPPTVAAFLTYDLTTTSCDAVSITANIDGVPLAASPNGTGKTGSTCQLGYFLTSTPPTPATSSTLEFVDGTGSSSETLARLFELRALVSTLSQTTVVHVGDTIESTWSTDSDVIDQVDASFSDGANQTQATTTVSGTTVGILVPSLATGTWTLNISVSAHAAVEDCSNASACSSQIVRSEMAQLSIQQP
jgi:hypothetical protein